MRRSKILIRSDRPCYFLSQVITGPTVPRFYSHTKRLVAWVQIHPPSPRIYQQTANPSNGSVYMASLVPTVDHQGKGSWMLRLFSQRLLTNYRRPHVLLGVAIPPYLSFHTRHIGPAHRQFETPRLDSSDGWIWTRRGRSSVAHHQRASAALPNPFLDSFLHTKGLHYELIVGTVSGQS